MSRMNKSGSGMVEMDIPSFGGLNTAKTFSEIGLSESPKMMNNLPRKIGGLSKRDGTIPLTTSAIGAIKTLTNLRKAGVNTILATAGTTLYKYATGAFTGVTMTNALASANIDATQFKDASSNEVLVITDGGVLKYFNGTAVANVTPAANDAGPAPANVLATLNTTMPPVGILVHNNRLVIWGTNTDQINHSKPGFYDYFRATDYQRFVKENDYIVQCATFSGAFIVLMRRHVGVLFGDGYTTPATSEDWSQDFLDTTDGCVNPKSVQLVIYPDGREELFYQSDRGVHAVYTLNTLSLDTSARYATKSVTQFQIDFTSLGVSKTEWANATAYFKDGRYWLIYKVGSAWKGLVFDTIDQQWRPVESISANSFYHDEDYFYFAGDEGHLKVFDSSLYSDWSTYNKAVGTGTPINWYWYSKLMTPKLTGYDHLWDILMIEAKQFNLSSTIDIEVNTYSGRYSLVGALKTEVMIIGVSKIGQAQIQNPNMTDYINNAKRIGPMGLKGQYAQIKMTNNRDEPVEVYSTKMEVRVMTKY
ncbi:hypothetical protein LOZ80_38090 [Paenibacillus sp. HWE-109]|uniref:hypothetical protein n=1 Tax=Paenibacillus sp. HWE-109 TaxID=1306526 RepID=UPI001EDCA53B|nr:hypothetical protein [Paenibacillus sp. HWE-109]UKS27204.1 hypothetical protein LOZ80_38090 [Paenibacillus sp. HWE-109]